ncbi:MAG TPA: hypothetical protein VFN67_21855 [Polyangiales bacterium]|nr:hypothetical protein [Polyangiales bacterium]
MHSNATITWDYFEGVAFVALRPGHVVRADLDAHLADLLARDEVTGIVVRASEGAPNPNQREQIHRWFERKKRRVAVLTNSKLALGGVTALRWFGLAIRGFSSAGHDDALTFVGIAPAKLAAAKDCLRRVIAAADALARSNGSSNTT